MWRCLRLFTGLGQQPGNVKIRLPPRLLVNLEFHSAEACRVGGETFEPLAFALGQQTTGLVGHDRWRCCRRAGGPLTLFSFVALPLVPAHLLFRLKKYFHDGILPGC